MKNTWKFLKFNQYQFEASDSTSIIVKLNNLSGLIDVKSLNNEDLFKIQFLGMFRSKIIVTDNKSIELLKLESKRWWKSNWFGIYQKKHIEVKIVNRPWVEYVLLIDGIEALTYGLKPHGGRAVLSVQQFIPISNQSDFLHVILFSLIRPVLIESMGNKVNMGEQ